MPSAVDISSVELYWDVPGDPLYQQFVYAFMQGITHERGASVWIQPSAHGISGISSPVEIQLRGLEGAPWGVYPEFIESTGREEYFKLHLANMKAREEWFREVGGDPVRRHRRLRTDAHAVCAGSAAGLLLAHARRVQGFAGEASARAGAHGVRSGRCEPRGHPRARAAQRRVPVRPRGGGRAAIRQERRRIDRHVRDFALRRELSKARRLRARRPVPREIRRHATP